MRSDDLAAAAAVAAGLAAATAAPAGLNTLMLNVIFMY